MFRDESTKVIQKAHAQWGVQDQSEAGEPSGSSPASTSPSSSSTRSRASIAESVSTVSPTSPNGHSLVQAKFPRGLDATRIDRAIQFYLEHYVVGLPDEAKTGHELQELRWVHAPVTREVMAAVGLASMSNLTGDKELFIVARQQYGLALQHTGSAIRDIQSVDMDIAIRAIIMLGMFEVVRGDSVPIKAAQTHIMGGAALLRGFLPFFGSSADGLRALMQLCFSMLASIQGSLQHLSPEPNVLIPTSPTPTVAEGVIPNTFLDWIKLINSLASAPDKPSAELMSIISRFVQLSALVRSEPFKDGQPETFHFIREAQELDEQLSAWEQRQGGIWVVTEERVGGSGDFFPADAVFEGCYHIYTDMWTARVWTHYRWARIMVNQLLLESVDRFPASSLPLVTAAKQRQSLDCIVRVARDTLVSIPTHYRHPRLERAHREYFDQTKGGAGIGAAGIPTLLFQIKVAGAAPGVPRRYWAWAVEILGTIWADTGMLQARRTGEMLSKARERGGGGSSSR
ncbi:hypothetical protein B0H67DRAFT_555429 [Lasiosphaeris hirsuta]|uniref:Uncharacterized protein n=1 Tax=Lasiosphaeris hirsuta TaxID=260670 RepID=A0AA40A8Z5_9PEZI|nr:hypothetical protein B0H67DRAFT_555429 [Lasiosphaeris hirsuta]